MNEYTIIKSFSFEYAHRIYQQKLANREEKCKSVHGHSGVCSIYISSNELNEEGMVIDFSNLNGIKNIIDVFDHSFIISSKDEDLLKRYNIKKLCYNVLKDSRCNFRWPFYFLKEDIAKYIIVEGIVTTEILACSFYSIFNDELNSILADLDSSNKKSVYLKGVSIKEKSNNEVYYGIR